MTKEKCVPVTPVRIALGPHPVLAGYPGKRRADDASEPVYAPDGCTIYYGGAWGHDSGDWIEHSDLFRIPHDRVREPRHTNVGTRL